MPSNSALVALMKTSAFGLRAVPRHDLRRLRPLQRQQRAVVGVCSVTSSGRRVAEIVVVDLLAAGVEDQPERAVVVLGVRARDHQVVDDPAASR